MHGALSPYCIALAAGGARILEATPSPEDRAAYRAPEQVRGEEPDVRSDVFAYGALVYEIASGKRAFPGAGAELNQRILTQPPRRCRPGSPISAALEGVIAGCLEKDPAQRRQRVQNAVIELKLAARRCPARASIRRVHRVVRSRRRSAAAPRAECSRRRSPASVRRRGREPPLSRRTRRRAATRSTA